MNVLRLKLAFLLILLAGCYQIQNSEKSLPTTPKPFVFKITKVVDKLTGEPIKTNSLTVTIKKGDEDPIEYETNDISEYRIEIPIGAEASVIVEAPGYHFWNLILRPNMSKYMEGPVELVPVDSNETTNGV